MLGRVCKPWYVYRPSQLLVRAARALHAPSPGPRPLRLAWGGELCADVAKDLGHSIWTTGIFEIAVSELFARLIEPGDRVVDGGANVGYMTLLAAVLAGPSGEVISFEPHPGLHFAALENVDRGARRSSQARVDLRNAAIGERAGRATLVLPSGDAFAKNDGISSIATDERPAGRTIDVAMETIDAALAGREAALLKLDIEGYELQALRGASESLAAGRIRHVIFEDHVGAESESHRLLRRAGYEMFSIGWSVTGPEIAQVAPAHPAKKYEAPNYLATLDPDAVRSRCAPRGWRVLDRNLAHRARPPAVRS